MLNILLVSLGGFCGSIARFLISLQFNLKYVGTLIVNITGSTLIALLYLLHEGQTINDTLWLLLGVGFCGAYTTFSTFSYESVKLFLNKNYKVAIIYSLSSLFLSLLSFFIILSIFK